MADNQTENLIDVISIEIAVPAGNEEWQDALSDLCTDKNSPMEWRRILGKENKLTMSAEDAAVRFDCDVRSLMRTTKRELKNGAFYWVQSRARPALPWEPAAFQHGKFYHMATTLTSTQDELNVGEEIERVKK